ncbi:MAG: protoporphyrinogen oxidase, partial [bacterium]|nr:protoporphyrinogen oxidase [bacterium]
MNAQQIPVVVVGGGIAGMAACHALAQKGIPFLLLEQSSRLGGVLETFREGPYQMEMGPFSFLPKAASLLKLAQDLGVGDERIEADPQAAQNRYVLKGRKLVRLPLTPKDFLFSPLLSPWAKLRFLLEPFAKGAPPHEETIAEFVKRRAGQAVLDNMIGPFVSGVVAGDPYKLSIAAQFPIFKELENKYGSLLKAFAERLKANPAPPTLFSFKNGMETLANAFLKKYGESVQLDTRLDVIPAKAGIQSIAKRLILATPAYIAAKLL